MTLSDDVPQSSKYRLIAEIGRGGMGEVLLAVAHGMAGFAKLIVLKRARLDLVDEPHVLAMFLDEARLAARLNHPNVVQTYEVGKDAGRPFIAMEYLDGQPLHRILACVGPRRFPLSIQIRIVIEALAGLHYAHELKDFDGTSLNVIHRDVTPQNIFVTYDGQIKVVDFGIAKAASSTIKTRAGMLKGKVAYMAPEQARSLQIDRRVDIFMVGVLLWEATVGDRMWQGIGNTEIIRRLSEGKLPSLPAHVRQKDPDLTSIVHRALAPVPRERYATAAELQHELEGWLARQGEAVPARAVGAFVAEHFEKERAKVKALLEQALRDYRSTASSKPEIRGVSQLAPDLEPTSIRNPASSRPPALVRSSLSVASATAGDTSPSAIRSATARASATHEITVTKRSSSPSPPPPVESSPPAAQNRAPSPSEDPAPTSPLDKESVLPAAPSPRNETLAPSSVSFNALPKPGPSSRSPKPRWKLWAIGSGILIPVAAAVAALNLGLPLSFGDRLSTLVSRTSGPGADAPGPTSAVRLSVRVLPATAQIFLDGTLVATGSYKGKLPRDDRDHVIRVEAPNFVALEESITASGDVIVRLALEREPARAR